MSSAVVVREDLSKRDPRERISKSFIQSAEQCGQRAWYQIHDPKPWTAPEQVTFGSAVDAGVEVIVKALARGRDEDDDDVLLGKAHHAAMQRVETEENAPDEGEVRGALERFLDWSVVQEVVWTGAVTQPHLRLELPGIGEVDAHPDLLLAAAAHDGIACVTDVKTTPGNKQTKFAATSYTELGLYALLIEASTGRAPDNVAYWQYIRGLKTPAWRESIAPVTSRMLWVARHRVAAVARAIEADSILNDGVAEPRNSSFTNGPKYASTCNDCSWLSVCDWADPIAEEVAA